MALTVLYVPPYGLDCLICAPLWPGLSYVCPPLALTVLYVPPYGVDCLICAPLAGMLDGPDAANRLLVVQGNRSYESGSRLPYNGVATPLRGGRDLLRLTSLESNRRDAGPSAVPEGGVSAATTRHPLHPKL